MGFRFRRSFKIAPGVRISVSKSGVSTSIGQQGAGVCVSRYWKAGSIDYKKVPELVGVDIEKYRSAGREEVRVSIAK